MDLDDEELKDTRKLNGVDKECNIEEDINLINLKEISERFSNGTETIEDIINYCRNYEIKFENGLKLRVVEKKYFDRLVKEIKKENKSLKIARKEKFYGYENTFFITENDLTRIDTNKYFIEIKEGNFIDVKQLYLDNLCSIPKQKLKELEEKIINCKIPRACRKGYYYDYLVNQKYKEVVIKLFKEILEDK